MNGLTKKDNAKILRQKLIQTISKQTQKNDIVGLMLSGGIDSSSILYSLLELQKDIHAYTFYLEGFESQDLKAARRLCEINNIPLTEIKIPLKTIKKNILYLSEIGCIKKTQFETKIHYLDLFPNVEERILLSGVEADNLQGTVRSMILQSSKDPQKFKRLREKAYDYAINTNLPIDYSLAENNGIQLKCPFAEKEIFDFYLQFDWQYLNKPYEKWILMNAFSEYFKKDGFRRHSDMQINSNMREYCKTLVSDNTINPKGRKRINEAYRDLAKLRGKP